ncbi:MAG: cysteine--tRNA ligase [bacterium]
MKLYNTLTRAKEEFKPIHGNDVLLYTCGPTVYSYAQIGNLKAYINEDVLKRSLELFGYNVKHVMNVTDVGHLTSDQDSGEDKLQKAATRERKTAWEIAAFYTETFLKDFSLLNITSPTVLSKATDYIKQQIDLVKQLEAKGFTYKTSDGVYYDTSKFANYGQLAKLDLAGLREGARVEINKEKKHPTDFALWKFSAVGEQRDMEWDSPWGKGFPGWHLECSAMALTLLGPTIDIHAGGVDHIPVHHTNEIAQSEGSTGQKFSNFWFHVEFLTIDSQRMGKSEGNALTLNDIIAKGFSPLSYRYFVLNGHYRTKMNFTWEGLQAAQNAYDKIVNIYQSWNDDVGIGCADYEQKFREALADDLNTPQTLAVLHDLLQADYPASDKKKTLLYFDKVLGLGLDKLSPIVIPEEIRKLSIQREQARQNKDWSLADKLRQDIEKHGFTVDDTEEGTNIKNNKP